MQTTRMYILILGLIVLSASGATAGQVPTDFYMSLTMFEDMHAMSGTMTSVDMTATWDITDYAGVVTFNGSSPTGFLGFTLTWLDTGGTLPLSVTITSTTAGIYSIWPHYKLPGSLYFDSTMLQTGITTSTYFGHYFPELDELEFSINLHSPDTLYDLTITLEWGDGVPTEATSWDQVKSLYR